MDVPATTQVRNGTRRLQVFVTVGMGPWPFDRLLEALPEVCAHHDVFVQTGTSELVPPCPHAPFLGYEETQRRIARADVVITHGGNTVRLVQRSGRIPIAVAREAARGEMRNDHQVAYLRREVAAGRVVALDGDLDGLASAVSTHPEQEQSLLDSGAGLPTVDGAQVADLLDVVAGEERARRAGRSASPFRRHPTARYRWAFDRLQGRTGRHLDLGIGDAEFAAAVHEGTSLRLVGADPHAGYLAAARRRHPDLALVHVADRLPFADGAFDSVTMLDVLEHTSDEQAALMEVSRVLRPGGLLVLTVPARHVFSFLDPDNAKFRFPRVHRAVYTVRFGGPAYEARFRDDSDGLRGDMAWGREWHTNYETSALVGMLEGVGLTPRLKDGANLFWRFWQVPALFLPARARRLLDAPLRVDGRLFRRANLFLTAYRTGDPTRLLVADGDA
jgi:SAM-dependent methyltransferase/UDP-N-acetylglucosamine transferase subunit ALG13